MRVVLTCPRAPITIEWIKIFQTAGYEVILVDSLDYPIAKFYNGVEYIKVASPRVDFGLYKTQMKKIVQSVDMVIANCEDIFFLCKVRDELKEQNIFFMPNSKLLFQLHHKLEFSKLLNDHIKFPKTQLITDKKQIKIDKKTILKPVFSRFGRSVIRDIDQKNIAKIKISKLYPWIQQEKIIGKAVCNYALIQDSKVIINVLYEPKYLLNQAASIYFSYYEDSRVDDFIKEFAQNSGYNGQIAFDFIDDGKDIYVIECNPRATSGLHLISDTISLEKSKFIKLEDKKVKKNCRVGWSLFILFGFKELFSGNLKNLIADHNKAFDILENLPFYAQFLSLYEMIKRAIIYLKPLSSASTFDIEYDGEESCEFFK